MAMEGKYLITDMVLKYQHGGEWMIGKTVKCVEPFTEDGQPWIVAEMIFQNRPILFRFPTYVFDQTLLPKFDTTADVATEEEPTTAQPVFDENKPVEPPKTPKKSKPIPNHAKSNKVTQTATETAKNALKHTSDAKVCKATTKSGKPCKGRPVNGSEYCMTHAKKGNDRGVE